MRIVKILLVLICAAVAAVYTLHSLSGQLSNTDQGPEIICDSEVLDISVTDDDSILLSGVTATDAQDGDLTGQVLVSGISKLISNNTARITYTVFDSDNNMATLTRSIHYTNYRLPRFRLEEPLIYGSSESITLLDRLEATDVIDGDLTDSIRVSYTEGTADPEVYTVDVQVTNSMGDTAWLTLPVIIQDSSRSVDVKLSTYLVYLEQGSRFNARDYLTGASMNGQSIDRSNVTISGEANTDTPGTYMISYTCSYGSRTGTAILTVVVE